MHKNMLKIFCILIFIVLTKISIARDIPISGFIFDHTKTKVGRDFYETFVLMWEYPSGFEHMNIIINEFTDPRWGSQIQIFVEDTLVFMTPLKPRHEDIETKVNEALDAVLGYFIYLSEQFRALEEEKRFL